MEVTYHTGPRILSDGTNVDQDIVASFPQIISRQIDDPVIGLTGEGYEPGQYNKNNIPL
jgi:hypothetical protein